MLNFLVDRKQFILGMALRIKILIVIHYQHAGKSTNWLQRDNIVPSYCKLFHCLIKELKTAIQCLGIKPKAINK